MKYLRDKKIGFNALNILVPIVSGAVIFDLTVGDPLAYPDEAMGYQACENADLDVAHGAWLGRGPELLSAGLGT